MLKIGWSKKDVSTELPVFIPGQFEIRISKGVMDPITLTALTIDSEGEYVIFLSCDLVGVNAGVLDAIRDKVSKLNSEIDPTKIVMHVTHAHSTPLVSMEDKTMWGYAEDFELNMNMYAKHKEESVYKTDGTPEENMKHNALINATNSRYEGVIKRYEEQKENPLHEMELHVIRLGDIAFATNQYELFIDYMHRIQGRSPFTQTFCIQLVAQPNNTLGGSYLATERAAHNVGYSATMYCNRISPEGGQQLVEETVKELNKLYEE